MTTGAVILWFLMATTGPRMDEGGPIAHPHSLAHFHTKTECEKNALKVVKENTLPGQVTTYSCVKSSDQDPDVPESYGNDETSKVYQVPVPLPEVYVVLIGRAHELMACIGSRSQFGLRKGNAKLKPKKNNQKRPNPTTITVATAIGRLSNAPFTSPRLRELWLTTNRPRSRL